MDTTPNPAPATKVTKKVMLSLGSLPPKPTNKASLAGPYPFTPARVNPNHAPWPAYRGYHESSFAHAVMGKRLHTILGNSIEDVNVTLNGLSDRGEIIDLIACRARMSELMDDLANNNSLRTLIDDGEGDVALWNKMIVKYFPNKDFMTATWLFAEAYKYRRLHECFSISKYWKDYDVFFRQKCDTFARSSDAVFELSTRFAEPFQLPGHLDINQQLAAKRLIFLELTQVCLWGNSTDLSLLIDMTEEDIKKLQSTGGDHLASAEKNILGNHLDDLWDAVKSMKGGRIDFVLDNAGFELYCDMVYADYLIQSGHCSKIYFHGKRFAWFVSDVTRKDWDWIINSCVYGHLFPDATPMEMESLRALGERWKSYEDAGIWVYEQHPFWTTGYTFWALPEEAPDVFHELSKSNLVIFKGDLNHRKLTYCCAAPASTPFNVAIGPMASTPGAPKVCSLRTIKSDVVVGLPSDEMAAQLDKDEPGWKISGKYAVVLLSQGTPLDLEETTRLEQVDLGL